MAEAEDVNAGNKTLKCHLFFAIQEYLFGIELGFLLHLFAFASSSLRPNLRFTSGFTPSEPEERAARTLRKGEAVQKGSLINSNSDNASAFSFNIFQIIPQGILIFFIPFQVNIKMDIVS